MSALAEKLVGELKKETEHIFYIGEMKKLNGEFISQLNRIMNGENDVAESLGNLSRNTAS